jgi:predicted ATPase with chaperone activity
MPEWRFLTILPAMTLPEAIETTGTHRVAGLTGYLTVLVTTHTFRALHRTISHVGLMRGEVLWAHHGFQTDTPSELTSPALLRSFAYEPPCTIMPSRAGSSRFPD